MVRATGLKAELLDSKAMDKLADPEPLIDDWLYVDSLARVVGSPGSLKSFIAIDMAAHIGSGIPWHGHDVKQGNVIYMLAEGAKGAKVRKQAWEKYYGKEMDNVFFLPRAIQIMSEEWEVFADTIRHFDPRLIVLDTQSRITNGVSENINDSEAFNRVDDLRYLTNACVMLIHHPAKGKGKGGRGGSIWIGGLDTEIWAGKEGNTSVPEDCFVTFENQKQKEAADGHRIRFSPVVVDLGTNKKGKPRNSLVVQKIDDNDIEAASRLDKREDKIIAFLKSNPGSTAEEIAAGLGLAHVRGNLTDMVKSDLLTAVGSRPKRYLVSVQLGSL